MMQLFEVARQVQQFMDQQSWSFCFIGGLALQRWGENRLTRDVDVCLFTDFGTEATFVHRLLHRFAPRRPDSLEFAMQHRVLLLCSEDGTGIDISLGGLPFERQLIARSSSYAFTDEIELRTCSAEDLVVLKAFANRPQDWVDIRGILVRQRGAVDRHAVHERLAPLAELKEEPEIIARWVHIAEQLPG